MLPDRLARPNKENDRKPVRGKQCGWWQRRPYKSDFAFTLLLVYFASLPDLISLRPSGGSRTALAQLFGGSFGCQKISCSDLASIRHRLHIESPPTNASAMDQLLSAISIVSDPSQSNRELQSQAIDYLNSVRSSPAESWQLALNLFVDVKPDGGRTHDPQFRLFALQILDDLLDAR